jgi:hypothetical protein
MSTLDNFKIKDKIASLVLTPKAKKKNYSKKLKSPGFDYTAYHKKFDEL